MIVNAGILYGPLAGHVHVPCPESKLKLSAVVLRVSVWCKKHGSSRSYLDKHFNTNIHVTCHGHTYLLFGLLVVCYIPVVSLGSRWC